MRYYKMFGSRYLGECRRCLYNHNGECEHPTSPSEMGRRDKMTWITDERGYAIFPNDCPLETRYSGMQEPEIRLIVEYPRDGLTRKELTDMAIPNGIVLDECSICGFSAPTVSYGLDKDGLVMDLYCEKCNNETGWHPWKETIEIWNGGE